MYILKLFRKIENSLRLHRIRRELISVRYCLELFCNELRSVMMMYSYEECRHAFACALTMRPMYLV